MVVAKRPCAALEPYIESLWYSDASEATGDSERVLPTGRFHIAINLRTGTVAITGMRARYIDIDTGNIEPMIGIVLEPCGAIPLLHTPASDFAETVTAWNIPWFDGVLEATSPEHRFRLLESTLLNRIAKSPLALHPAVGYAVTRLQHRRISEISRDAGLSRRRFSQLFREQIGMTPKLYCRLHRFLSVIRGLASGAPVDWAAIAQAGGYSDQAHLIHDFREFSGLTPSAFLSAERPFPTHIRLD